MPDFGIRYAQVRPGINLFLTPTSSIPTRYNPFHQ
jgi:hypothetical protein